MPNDLFDLCLSLFICRSLLPSMIKIYFNSLLPQATDSSLVTEKSTYTTLGKYICEFLKAVTPRTYKTQSTMLTATSYPERLRSCT